MASLTVGTARQSLYVSAHAMALRALPYASHFPVLLKFICSELGTRQAEIRFSSVRPLRLANALLAPTGYFTRLRGAALLSSCLGKACLQHWMLAPAGSLRSGAGGQRCWPAAATRHLPRSPALKCRSLPLLRQHRPPLRRPSILVGQGLVQCQRRRRPVPFWSGVP